MAFLETTKEERFSLLLLEPGEIYFEDYSVFYYPGDVSESEAIKRKQKGRLKVCSKSLLFDPKDYTYPVLKLPLRECGKIDRWQGSLISKIDKGGNVIHLECSQVVEMLEGNYMAPYTFKREKKAFLFALQYVNVENCLPQICQLQRASTLPTADQASMIAAIVCSRQSRVKFNTSWLEDLYEKIILETTGNKITPLVINPGRILLTSSRLYFQPYNNAEPWPVLKVKLSDIKRIIKRRFLLSHIGMELYCKKQCPIEHLFLSFKTQKERDILYSKLVDQTDVKLDDAGKENMTLLWQNGVVSNYDYLLYLNSLADRSFNDLTQYPVFPWLLQDYTSESIDIADESVYRDLSKPMGALNENRLCMLKERYKEMEDHKFLYGSHYSTPGFVLYYLVRKMPQYMLCLQNGRFDHPDRMFNSIADTWRNVTTGNSDFKELIPEFYDTEGRGSFLKHAKNLDFGVRSNGLKVWDVELPPWAKGPEHFVQILRNSLESDYVSQHLHSWIDLIFGYKQRGEEAIKADNVFYYLTYEGSVDIDSIRDLNERHSLEVQIMEFGQIPKQLFIQPHPQRRAPSPPLGISFFQENLVEKERKHSLDETETKQRADSCHLWSEMDMTLLSKSSKYCLHKDVVTDVCIAKNMKYVFSVSQDSLLKMYSLEDKRQLRSINVYNMALSSCVLMEDNKTVIVGSWDNYVYVYNIEYGKVLATTMAHDDAVTDIYFNKGLLATASMDSTAKIWIYDTSTRQRSSSFAAAHLQAELDHDTSVNCISLNNDNTMLVSGTTGGQVNLWDLRNYSVLGQYSNHYGVVHTVAFNPDGQKVASCGSDCTLKVLDVKTGTLLFSKDTKEELRCLCWNGHCAITGTSAGNLIIWDLIKAELLKVIPGHSGAVSCITVADDGSVVVTGGEDFQVIVWRVSCL